MSGVPARIVDAPHKRHPWPDSSRRCCSAHEARVRAQSCFHGGGIDASAAASTRLPGAEDDKGLRQIRDKRATGVAVRKAQKGRQDVSNQQLWATPSLPAAAASRRPHTRSPRAQRGGEDAPRLQRAL